jgi:tripartite-type tricarboxylate transporter receptor subunit TctC
MKRRSLTLAFLATVFATAFTGSAFGQAFPTKPVTVIVPFSPGGSSDASMRVMSAEFQRKLGQPVVLENKPGANGTIGATFVTRAPADGYTLLVGSIGTYAITPLLLKPKPYEPLAGLDLLTIAVRTPNVFAVPANLPVNTVAELVAYMKKNPGKVAFASSGVGSTDHLTSVLFWQKTGTEGLHIAYKGGGAAITDLIAGHVQVLISNVGVLAPYIQNGRLKGLAVTSEKRVPELPNIPTISESGFKGLEVYSWQGISAPHGLPAPVKQTIVNALHATLADPQVRAQLEKTGFEVVDTGPDKFKAQLTEDIQRWKTVIDTAGITAE